MDYLNKLKLNEIKINDLNDIQNFSIIFYAIFGFSFISIILLYFCKNSIKNKNKNFIKNNKNKYSV